MRKSYKGFLGDTVYHCGKCGTPCERYTKRCAKCGTMITDEVERLVGPALDEVAYKHHGMLPEDCDEYEEP